jgi:hypothetical protein
MILEDECPLAEITGMKKKCDTEFDCGYGYYQITEAGRLYSNDNWCWWTSLEEDLKTIQENQLLWLMTDQPVDPEIIKIRVV